MADLKPILLVDDNPNDPNDNEYDGLDEVFLPEDVTTWKPNAPVPKAARTTSRSPR